MIERITSTTNPDLFILRYSEKFEVLDLTVIPKFFFIPQIIEKRRALSDSSRRAGWVGCNILLSEIPEQGRIPIIVNQHIINPMKVIDQYRYVSKMQTRSMESKSWLFDILNCVNKIKNGSFSLSEIYAFEDELKNKHLDNHNIEAKIRQQLQKLRDKKIIEFVGRGVYRKIQ